MLGAEAYNVVQRKIALDHAEAGPEEGALLMKGLADDVVRESAAAVVALAEMVEPPKAGD